MFFLPTPATEHVFVATTASGGTSVAPPVITVAVSGLNATITNTGGAAASINWGDGTTNTSLTHTYSGGGLYTVVASNGAGGSTAYACVGVQAFPVVTLMRSAGKLWSDAGKTNPVSTAESLVRTIECTFTGTTFQTPSDSERLVLKDDGSGKWSLYYGGTQSIVGATITSVGFSSLRAIWDGGGSVFPDYNGLLAGVAGDSNGFRGEVGNALWRSVDSFFTTIRVDGTATTTLSPFGSWHVSDGTVASPVAAASGVVIGNAPSAAGRFWIGRTSGFAIGDTSLGTTAKNQFLDFLNDN